MKSFRIAMGLAAFFCATLATQNASAVSDVGLRSAVTQSDPASVLLEVFLQAPIDQAFGDDKGWSQEAIDGLALGQLKTLTLTFNYEPASAWASPPVVPAGVGGGDLFADVLVDITSVISETGLLGTLAMQIAGAGSTLTSGANLDAGVVVATVRVSRPDPLTQAGSFLLTRLRFGDYGDDGTVRQANGEPLASQSITPVPEPSRVALVATGIFFVALRVRRMRRTTRR
jgi:hypothetical protein